ncbi:uncharacterized protein LOC142373593 [Odontesthes bonariensis]|uniref:uncharacterized protein LOC142373593 n=1 Tax=Odontesthes bonariensis TaxID=219752 RepID=UPI003F585414
MVRRRIPGGAGMPGRWSLQPDDPTGPSLVPPVPAASTSELEQTQDSRDLNVDQLSVIKDEVPWSSSLDQQDLKALHIKEEEEELNGQEAADISRFSFTSVTVKREDDEDPQSSQLHQIKTEDYRETELSTSSSTIRIKAETDVEDGGGPEPNRNPDLNNSLQSNNDEKISDSSETEVSDEDYWQKSSDSGPETEKNLKRTIVTESAVNHDVVHDKAKTSLSCSACGKMFLYKLHLTRHMREHRLKKTFACNDCGKRFNYMSRYKNHMKVHTGEKPFGCDVCGKRYGDRGSLSSHTRVHTGEKPFACVDCGKRFKQNSTLKKHMKVHTGEKPFGCHVCGKRFKEKANLKGHMTAHTGEKPFACQLCDKRFSQQGALSGHKKVHTGEKPFACDECGKRFHTNSNLKTHIRVHTGEKPFGCDVCSKRFNRNERLKTHLRVHTGEKPFGCDVCGKRFSERGTLSSHTRLHTGEKPFACGECGRTFNTNSHLKRHMKVHTKEKLFDFGGRRKRIRCTDPTKSKKRKNVTINE